MRLVSLPIRVGLVGYGYAGSTFHAPLIAATPGLNLTAVVSKNPEKVKTDWPNVSIFDSLPDLLRKCHIDLVIVATPVEDHAETAIIAIQAGKHVVMEQPFTRDFAEAHRVVALAQDHACLLAVFHKGCWEDQFRTLQTAITGDVLGRVTHFESNFDRSYPRDSNYRRPGPDIDLWQEIGSDLISQAVKLFPPPYRVQASLARQREGTCTDDWMHVVIEQGKSCRIILHGGLLAASVADRFTVHGTRGSCTVKNPSSQEYALRSGHKEVASLHDSVSEVFFFDGSKHRHARKWESLPYQQASWLSFYIEVASALVGEGLNPSPPMEALTVVAVLEAILKSAHTGKRIRVPGRLI